MTKFKTIKIYCSQCKTLLYKYYKAGDGHLVKCYQDRIKDDFTKGDLKCPNCGSQFAREKMMHGKPANKIVQGKVYTKS